MAAAGLSAGPLIRPAAANEAQAAALFDSVRLNIAAYKGIKPLGAIAGGCLELLLGTLYYYVLNSLPTKQIRLETPRLAT